MKSNVIVDAIALVMMWMRCFVILSAGPVVFVQVVSVNGVIFVALLVFCFQFVFLVICLVAIEFIVVLFCYNPFCLSNFVGSTRDLCCAAGLLLELCFTLHRVFFCILSHPRDLL